MIGRDAPPKGLALELEDPALAPPDERPTPRWTPPPGLTRPVGSMVLAPELAELATLVPQMGPRARAVLLEVGRRLAAGAYAYKDDFGRMLDPHKEARAEAVDAAIYLALELTGENR